MTDHPDLEALSASLDGEGDAGATGGVAAHVAACPRCRTTRARLAAARDAVAQPVLPASDVVREQAIAAALAAAATPAAPAGPAGPAAPIRQVAERRRWWLGGGAAAAVLAVAVGTAALVGQQPADDSNTALSGRAPAAETLQDSAAGGSASGSGAGAAAPAAPLAPTGEARAATSAVGGLELGDVADVAALKSRLATAQGGAAASFGGSANPGAGASVAREVGTRVCEVEARMARPQLGTVLTSANLRYQGIPAVALQFSPTVQDPVVRLLVLAPDQGCRLLVETTVP
jgi:anti-sigma factor RsiW